METIAITLGWVAVGAALEAGIAAVIGLRQMRKDDSSDLAILRCLVDFGPRASFSALWGKFPNLSAGRMAWALERLEYAHLIRGEYELGATASDLGNTRRRFYTATDAGRAQVLGGGSDG